MSAEPATRRSPPGLGQVVGRLLGEARQLVADYAELTVLDARRAAIRLAWILGSVLVAAVLVVTSWMGLVAAGIVFAWGQGDRKSTRLNSSHVKISYAVFCLKKKKKKITISHKYQHLQ